MIKLEKTEVVGWEAAIRGMRNPMNSWDKSDSGYVRSGHCDGRSCIDCDEKRYNVGSNDHSLMTKLANAGTDHRKFMRMIVVYVDITAPLYWWSEYDTYKVGTVANSCSKMHKMLAKPFEMNDFSFDKLPGYKNEPGQYIPDFDYEKEVWKEIGKTGYEVSDLGRIRHNNRILAGSYHSDGYVFTNIKGKQIPIHRFVASTFIPNPENKPEVNHKDGNKMNNSVENLEWVTRKENIKHAHDNNLQPKGLATYTGKFTEEQREEIKSLWNSGKYSRRELAKKYGVSHTCINDIINNKYRYATKVNIFETVARPIIDTLNELRDSWIRESDPDIKKQIWYSILQLLPSSYNQKRTVMLNYEVLANIYKSRKNHKLDEWRELCKWIESLPYSELITKTCEKKDLVEVCRCKNCKYYISAEDMKNDEVYKKYENMLKHDGLCMNTDAFIYENDFCSCGEKEDTGMKVQDTAEYAKEHPEWVKKLSEVGKDA